MTTFQLGLNSFGEVATDGDRVLSDAETAAAARRGGAARGVGRPRRVQRRRALPRRPQRLRDARAARRDRDGDRADPARHVGHGAQHQRPRAALPRVLHPGRASRTAARSSCSAARRRPSRSRCSATTWPTTSSCSRRSSTSSCGSARGRGHLVGHGARPARRRSGCTRGCARAASRPGSASAAARTRWSAPPATGCRSCSPSSAAGPQRFAGHVELYQRALDAVRARRRCRSASTRSAWSPTPTRRPRRPGGGIGSRWWPRSARERGFYAPTRERYEAEIDHGALFVGSPETVARKIAATARDLRLSRFDLKYDVMHLPREARARTIELLGREVAPRVRELLTKEPSHV